MCPMRDPDHHRWICFRRLGLVCGCASISLSLPSIWKGRKHECRWSIGPNDLSGATSYSQPQSFQRSSGWDMLVYHSACINYQMIGCKMKTMMNPETQETKPCLWLEAVTYDVSDSVISLSDLRSPWASARGPTGYQLQQWSYSSNIISDLSLCTTRLGCQPYSVHVPVGR